MFTIVSYIITKHLYEDVMSHFQIVKSINIIHVDKNCQLNMRSCGPVAMVKTKPKTITKFFHSHYVLK